MLLAIEDKSSIARSIFISFLSLSDHWGTLFTFKRVSALSRLVGWLVVLGLTALLDSISVYIGPSPKERETEERKDR